VENRDSAPGFSTFVALTPRFVEDRRTGARFSTFCGRGERARSMAARG